MLLAGRLIEHKNVDLLLDAFDAVAADHDVALGIIDDEPEHGRLERKQQSHTHPERIDFLGFLENYEDVLGQMRAADVFASPSIREGFLITFVEAMAADCTVIAASHPKSAADEVISEAGFLVDPTVNSIATRLGAVLGGEQSSINPTERAQRDDWDTVADQAEAVYKRAIKATWWVVSSFAILRDGAGRNLEKHTFSYAVGNYGYVIRKALLS